jgi:hypothetical protein
MAAAAGTAVERGFETRWIGGPFESHGRVVAIDCILSAFRKLTAENAEHPMCRDEL